MLPEKLKIGLKLTKNFKGFHQRKKVTLKDGQCTIEKILPGEYDVTLMSKLLPRITQNIEILPNKKTYIEFEVEENYSVSGVISSNKTALKDAEIRVSKINKSRHRGNNNTKSPIMSDEKGGFSVKGLLPGNYKISVKHPKTNTYSQDIEIIRESLGNLQIELKYGKKITGKIFNKSGQPYCKAKVSISPTDYGGSFTPRSSTSNPGRRI